MKTPIKIIAVLVLIFFTSQKIFPATYYVSPSGVPSGNYYTDIQSAVNASSAGDLVLVSNGVYNSGGGLTPGYVLTNRVVIINNITVRSVSGPENTIILGNEAIGGGTGDGAVRCVFMTSGSLSGFTLSNGFTSSSGSYDYDQKGGGIWLTNGCIIANCIISRNSADDGGGGVYCYYGGTISDCIISGNSSYRGGGVYCYYGGSVSDCNISGNTAEYGGGVNCDNGGSVSFCTISGNGAGFYGGGTYCYSGGTVFDCFISGNTSEYGGGAFCDCGGTVSDCTIIGNTAVYNGGGVSCDYGGTISGCTINGNTAEYGGGAYCKSSGALTNCLICGMNTATYGGGSYLKDGGEIYNCTIAGNNASGYGGGICTTNGGTVVNVIIYENQALLGNDNWRNYASGALFSYCCTTPTNGLPGGNECIFDNPMFVIAGSDYHLLEISPCVDTGYNMPWMIGANDLEGAPRIYNTIVDMGAFEFSPVSPFIGIPVASPNWKLKNKKKGVLNGKPITPLLYSYLTNGYGIGIWNLDTDSNVDGPRKLTAKNKKETVWVFKDKADKAAKIIYSEKYNKRKDIYKTKLKYVLQGQIPESNMVYIAPLE